MPETDPFDDPAWLDYAAHVIDSLVPMTSKSKVIISLVPSGPSDVKFAVELGMSIMMDKPIVLLVTPGAKVPDHLRRAADAIIEGSLSDPNLPGRVNDVLRDLVDRGIIK